MSYRLGRREPVVEATRRIAMEQLDTATGEIDDAGLPPDKTIRQVRKRCKMLRGLIRLVRPPFESTYQQENIFLRETARSTDGASRSNTTPIIYSCWNAWSKQHPPSAALS